MLDGKIVLENSDAVKITISCPVYIKKDSKKIYQQLLQFNNNSKLLNKIQNNITAGMMK